MDAAVAQMAAEWHPTAVAFAKTHARALGSDRTEAESVAGEAVIEASTSWLSADHAGAFEAFLSTVVRRRVIDDYRARRGRTAKTHRRKAEVTALSLDAALRASDHDGLRSTKLSDVLVAHDSEPDVVAEVHHRVSEAVRRSGVSPRDLYLLMSYEAGWKLHELGAAAGVTESRACQRVKAAQKRLRNHDVGEQHAA